MSVGGDSPYGQQVRDPGTPAAAATVRQIFEQFIGGRGLFAIAEHLTREGIASPSAHDPARNRHRCGIAWSKSAVRAILLNPRYTGRQVWNKQRKDGVLIDVNDVALGHTTRMRWNEAGQWIYSEDLRRGGTRHQPATGVLARPRAVNWLTQLPGQDGAPATP